MQTEENKDMDFEASTETLEQVMDEIGAKAQERGLTDNILRDILNNAQSCHPEERSDEGSVIY